MTSADTGQHLDRPPFGEMLRLSFRRLWKSLAGMPLIYALAFVGLLAISLGTSLGPLRLTSGIARSGNLSSVLTLGWSTALAAMQLLFLTPLSIAVYRFVLCDDTNGWRAMAMRGAGVFFAWSLLLEFATGIVTSWYVFLPLRFIAIMTFLTAVGSLAAAAVQIRLLPMFPAMALGTDASFLERARVGWQQTRGHFWYLLGLDLMMTLALSVPFALLSELTKWSRVSEGGAAAPHGSLATAYAVGAAVLSSLGVVVRSGGDAAVGGNFYRAVIGGGPSDVERTAAHFI